MLRPPPLAFLLLTTALAAQQVPLPSGTGSLTRPAEWTALAADDLRRPTRPGDPVEEPARSRLLSLLAELQRLDRCEEHVVLYMPSPDGTDLRIVNAYAAPDAVTSAELHQDAAIERLREALVRELSRPDAPAEFIGGGASELFAVDGLRMRLRQQLADGPRRIDVHLVPAAEHLQYFECSFPASDAGAEQAIAGLLRTFDGAREPGRGAMPLVVAGALGALAGILTALIRRRRQAQRILNHS